MKQTIASALIIMFLLLPIGAVAGNNYYKKYKSLKVKYEKLEKKYKNLKKENSKMGNDAESYYIDLVQCQRKLNGENPWEGGAE